MIIRLNFKTPDVLDIAINEALEDMDFDVDKSEEIYIRNRKTEEIREVCKKWIKNGEAISIEIDTEKETAEVAKV